MMQDRYCMSGTISYEWSVSPSSLTQPSAFLDRWVCPQWNLLPYSTIWITYLCLCTDHRPLKLSQFKGSCARTEAGNYSSQKCLEIYVLRINCVRGFKLRSVSTHDFEQQDATSDDEESRPVRLKKAISGPRGSNRLVYYLSRHHRHFLEWGAQERVGN